MSEENANVLSRDIISELHIGQMIEKELRRQRRSVASATGFAQFANSSASSTSSEVKRSYDRFGISYNSYGS